jgi:pilus assembly protein CpaC
MRLIATLLCCLWATPLAGADGVTLYAGESKLLDLEDSQRVLQGNPAVLEAKILDQHQVLLGGRSPGQTSLLVWDRAGVKHSFEVEVLPAGLKRQLVEIDVQVLEIADGVQWDAGLDWAGLAAGNGGVPSGALTVLEQSPPLLNWGTFARGAISARLDALIQDNKARLLAKPRLVTMSGTKARFLSGGQVPVAAPDKEGRSSTTYKDYGISLDIEPRADEDGNVSAQVRAEMSDLDPANAVSIGNGGILPAVKTRWVETSVFVRKDSTLVLAGLLHEEEGTITAGVPILSAIPVLGELFKHHESIKKKTELVIFLSPKVLL